MNGGAGSTPGAESIARKKETLDGQPVPDANEEYLLYQTLVGVWPLEPLSAASLASS